jgi:uncharacterized protein (TIGR00369 family)
MESLAFLRDHFVVEFPFKTGGLLMKPTENNVMGLKPITQKIYGIVAADRQKEMSGLEFVQGLVEGTLPLNTIARTLGYEITEVASGRVVVTAEPSDAHLNPWGTVHGGLAATLLDSCMGLAIQSTLEKGVGSTTLEFKISFVRPITPDTGPIKSRRQGNQLRSPNMHRGRTCH